MSEVTYEAPQTVADFMLSNSFGRIVAGPVGSGKTTGCLWELFRRACEQSPSSDGLRYTRFAIVRQTLKQLKDTVLKDILTWIGPVANYKVSDGTVYVEAGDVRSEFLLIPLEDMEDQRRLLSMQLTGAWASELIEMDIGIIPPLSGRCGRFPSAAQGGALWHGIIADTNMPAAGSPWHKFMNSPPPEWQVFIQPSGLAENAENLEYLTQTPETLKLKLDDPARRAQGRKYYQRFVNAYGEDSSWVKRYVKAEYGDDPSGSAVFRESFKSAFHIADTLDPVSNLPLIVGQDFGRDPCSVIAQVDHKGRLLILEEVLAEDVGLELHVQRSLRPALTQARYLGKTIALIGDPAGRAKSSIHEETSFDALKRLGFAAHPAPTNDIDPRIRAVEAFLLAQRDGGAAILIDRARCPTIINALSGGYRYAKTKAGLRKPVPDKNDFSHVMDALQYVCLAAHGGMTELMSRHMARRAQRQRNIITPGAWT